MKQPYLMATHIQHCLGCCSRPDLSKMKEANVLVAFHDTTYALASVKYPERIVQVYFESNDDTVECDVVQLFQMIQSEGTAAWCEL